MLRKQENHHTKANKIRLPHDNLKFFEVYLQSPENEIYFQNSKDYQPYFEVSMRCPIGVRTGQGLMMVPR